MRRERVPKEVWIRFWKTPPIAVESLYTERPGKIESGFLRYVLPYKPTPPSQTEAVPSRSTVEQKLRDALTRWIALEWQEFKGGEPTNLYSLAKARIAVRDAFLRATRKDAR